MRKKMRKENKIANKTMLKRKKLLKYKIENQIKMIKKILTSFNIKKIKKI